MVSRGMGAAFGFMLFANPLLGYIIDELDRTIPDWKERLILEQYVQTSQRPTSRKLGTDTQQPV